RRIDGGLPSCAQHCIGRAITLVSEEELAALVRGRSSWKTGRIVYVSGKWSSLGAALREQTET
ncbi:MAG: hypothetical protein IH628_01260, partial [Proteobacteria bacterium]|nr:hypothetical protein [Pseudomonadota bacterium]